MTPAHPRTLADEQPRAVLYLRQSTFREESISLELQETAGREYCQRQGYKVVAVEADPGISGRTWKRPAVQRVMAMIEDDAADVVVLWKWSRLSRSRRDWAVAADRAEVAGGRIESATEPIDVTTSAGRFARGVMTELAAFESERIGDGWREAHERRTRAGLPANGKPRWGYIYDADAKIHRPDPALGPVLADVYARYVAGESVYSLVRWLNAGGYRTTGSYSAAGPGPWSDRSLRRVLDSGFAAGLITVRGEKAPGAHEALIDEALWQAYQVARNERRVTRSSERSQYVLSGLVRCSCGSAMTGGQFGEGRVPKFRCKAGKEAGRHAGGYVTMRLVEEHVLAWLAVLAGEVDAAAEHVGEDLQRARHSRDQAKFLEREVATARGELVRATRGHVSGVIPQEAYVVVRDELEQRIAGLEARLLAASVAGRRAPAGAIASALLRDWDELAVEHRRGALRQLLTCVVVTPGRPRAQLAVRAAWEGDGR
jgi:site-specific DNA recombinase